MNNSFKERWLLIILFPIVCCVGFFWYSTELIKKLQQRIDRLSPQQEPTKAAPIATGEAGIELSDRCEWTLVRKELRDSVVQVFSHIGEFNLLEPYRAPNQGQSRGSAFFISVDGKLITNAHVVDQAKSVFIQIPSQGKRQFEVDVIAISMERDLALLQLKPQELGLIIREIGSLPFLKCSDSDTVHGSEEIMTLGFPLGQQSLKGTTGIVSGRERINGQYMIQISAPINPGNSGGPSINRCGQVVGVNTLTILSAQNVNYIIPSNEVKLFLAQVDRLVAEKQTPDDEKKVLLTRKGSLGLIYATASDDLARHLGNPVPGGLYVTDVCPESLVDKAGLKPGDMVYEFNGSKLDIFGEMRVPWTEEKVGIADAMSRMMLGDTIKLKIYRQGTPHELSFHYNLSSLPPIRKMYPGYEAIDYEIVGGMVIMQLSINLLQIMVPSVPDLAWYLDVRHQMEPALVITHLMPDSVLMRARVMSAGSLIAELNGKKVKTLDEFRTILKDSIDTNVMTLKTKENLYAVIPFDQVIGEEEKLSRNFYYQTTPCVRDIRLIMQEKAKKALTQKADDMHAPSLASSEEASLGKEKAQEGTVDETAQTPS